MELRPRRVEVAIDGLPGARLWIDGGSRETARQSLVMPLAPDSVTSARLFIVAPGEGPARQDFTIAVRPLDNDPRGDSGTIQRSEEHKTELQSLLRISYAVLCLKIKTHKTVSHLPRNTTATHSTDNRQ